MNMDHDLKNTSIENEIKSTTDIDELNTMIQSVLEHESIENFSSNNSIKTDI